MTSSTIKQIVIDIIKEHPGGREFFDALDNTIRQHDFFFSKLYQMAIHNEDGHFHIVVSGRFGIYFTHQIGLKTLLINGGLRSSTGKVMNLEPFDIQYKSFVLFDDSFYSGTTRDKIKEAIELHKGKLLSTYVVYDGSKVQKDDVYLLYRYYSSESV